jgi:hypothetical protein
VRVAASEGTIASSATIFVVIRHNAGLRGKH